MSLPSPKIRFDKSGFYFTGLILLALLGFWPSYFSKFFETTETFSFYFHFHALMMSFWVLILIVQPLLIRKKKPAIHKLIGKLSYLIMPLLLASVILLAHSRIEGEITEMRSIHLLLTVKDITILGVAYFIGIKYRHQLTIHARAMVATGIVFIEPALVRFMNYAVFKGGDGMVAYACTVAILYSIIAILILMERKQKEGRWVFPLILFLYITFHSLLLSGVQIPLCHSFAKWFAGLPLT